MLKKVHIFKMENLCHFYTCMSLRIFFLNNHDSLLRMLPVSCGLSVKMKIHKTLHGNAKIMEAFLLCLCVGVGMLEWGRVCGQQKP